MSKFDKILRIVFSVLFIAAVAALGIVFTDTSSEWYLNLKKPALQPPDEVFPIVWSALYILIAVSLSLVSINPKTSKKTLLLYAANGLLNVLWSYLFFYKNNAGGALIVLVCIIITAAMLFAQVYPADRVAAYLLIPYIIWLFFALCLNYEIAFLN